jgi:hypothetical protein
METKFSLTGFATGFLFVLRFVAWDGQIQMQKNSAEHRRKKKATMQIL